MKKNNVEMFFYKETLIAVLMWICLLTFRQYSYGQTLPENLTKSFFDKYGKESPNTAIDYIYSTNKWSEELKAEISNMKYKLNGIIESLGKYRGYDLITKKSVGSSLVSISYIVKYDRQPLRFTFILYMPEKEWTLYSFLYDAKLDEELKEASKAYRLSENLPLIPVK